MKRTMIWTALAFLIAVGNAAAAEVTVTMNKVSNQGVGEIIGTIVFRDTPAGLNIRTSLTELTEGRHGFHIHQNSNCGTTEKGGIAIPGLAAGGHFDPSSTSAHRGPLGKGHLGDLPLLYVDFEGRASSTIRAPRVKTSDLAGRAIIIHASGDNYQDIPKRLGGGGAGVACGTIIE